MLTPFCSSPITEIVWDVMAYQYFFTYIFDVSKSYRVKAVNSETAVEPEMNVL